MSKIRNALINDVMDHYVVMLSCHDAVPWKAFKDFLYSKESKH